MFAKIIEHFTGAVGQFAVGIALIALVVFVCATDGPVKDAFVQLLNSVFTTGSGMLPV